MWVEGKKEREHRDEKEGVDVVMVIETKLQAQAVCVHHQSLPLHHFQQTHKLSVMIVSHEECV